MSLLSNTTRAHDHYGDSGRQESELLGRVGRYVAAASGPPLSASAARSARNCLETMLSVNTREALGDEWIAAGAGSVQKTDAGGQELDPMWTGRQPVLWDLAGAMLEWDLDPVGEHALLSGFPEEYSTLLVQNADVDPIRADRA